MPKDSMVRFCHINTLSMELDARINESVLMDNESDSDSDSDEDDSYEETDLAFRRTVKRRLSFQSVLLKQENNDSMVKWED